MTTYPWGNNIICRFAFILRKLTNAELETFLAGGGLPVGVGTDPNQALFEYKPAEGEKTTATTGEVVHDATGAFHVVLPGTVSGLWEWRGRGLDTLGNPVAATPWQTFTVGPE